MLIVKSLNAGVFEIELSNNTKCAYYLLHIVEWTFDFFYVLLADMGVALRCLNVIMPKQLLYKSEVGAGLHEMRGPPLR